MVISTHLYNYLPEYHDLTCECGELMTSKKMDHDTYVYCTHCFSRFGRLVKEKQCCDNMDRQPALRPTYGTSRTKHIQLITQCISCWDAKGNSLPQKGRDLSQFPVVDRDKEHEMEILRNKQFKEVAGEFRSLNLSENNPRFEVEKAGFSFKNYKDYMRSDKWKVKRKKVLERDNYTCVSCLEEKATQVHHITYDNLGDEPLFNLVSVCGKCHCKIHGIDSLAYREEKMRLYRNLLS